MNPPFNPANPSGPQARSRAFRLLFVCLMATGIGNSMLFAILPPLARELDVAEVYVGAIYTLSALLFLTMSPVWGALSDRLGRRPLIVFGLASFAVSTLVFAAGAWAGQIGLLPPLAAIVAMALARCLFGGLGSATNPAAQAYVADRTSPMERTKALAGLTAAFGLGGMIGPALAAGFVERIGIAPFMIVIAALVGAGALVVRFTLPENTPPKRQGRPINPLVQFRFALDPRLTAFMIYGCALWLSQAASLQALSFYVMDRLAIGPDEGLQLAGVALSAGAAALIFAQLAVIPALKTSPRVLMIIGAALVAAGNLEMVFAPNYAAIVVGFMLNSFGFGLARSGFTAGASLAVSPEEQGRAAGLTTATAGVGFLIAPLTGLWLYQVLAPEAPFWLNAALGLVGLAVAFAHPRVRAAAARALEEPGQDGTGPV
ncbi:MFS transporter [Alkalicaulis satelles]|uniref:MFS transporter n=1 Tax=Alkalicaulis satelles TaxID=2609175 RepID=A0A5M6ZNX0_9PROT|nr:MFS transporter [Alkalicaulis satelles]KAA5803921.1 MFS transporter [Alkalicaulis satelles]